MRWSGTIRRTLRLGCAVLAAATVIGLAADLSFSAAAVPGAGSVVRKGAEGQAFQLVAFGDPEDEIAGFEDIFAVVGETSNPDFGVVLGDVAKHSSLSRESYAEYLDALRRLQPDYPILTVPGNHDRPDEGEVDEYAETFGALDWWFEHAGCVFVGIDNSRGTLTDGARATLRAAAGAAAGARKVFVFLHVPVFGAAVEPGANPARAAQAARVALAQFREDLGVDVDVVVSAHTAAWSVAADEKGTLHVCCGAEPGLGWPARSTPQIAAVLTVDGDDVDVAQVRVPHRQDLVTTLRQVAHLKVHNHLRRWLAPVPVWGVAVLALAALVLLAPRRAAAP